MKKILIIIPAISMIIAFTSCAQDKLGGKGKVKLETAEDSLAYAFGVAMGSDIKNQFNLSDINGAAMAKGAEDAFGEDGMLTMEEARTFIRGYYQQAQSVIQEQSKQASDVFMAENKEKEGVKETASGLQYEVIEEGDGPKPAASDEVTVHYHGTLVDGTVFDSSLEDEPRTFQVGQVIPGWSEALQLMSVGSKYKLYIPPHLAYGERGVPNSPIKPNSALIFEVELLDVQEAQGE